MRASRIDDRVQPVVNLVPNPGFVRAVSGTSVFRKNLAAYNTRGQDPGFSVTVNNTAGLSNNRWFGNSGAGTRERFVTGGPTSDLQAYIRKTWTGQPLSGPADCGFTLTRGFQSSTSTPSTTSGIPVKPGTPYTVSIYTRTSMANAAYRIQTQFRDSSGNYISSVLPASVANLTNWTRLSSTFVPPPKTATAEIILYVAIPTIPLIGDWIDATGLLIEERPVVLPYFDGYTIDNSGIVYSFDGAVDASTSSAKSAILEVRRNLATDPLCSVISNTGPRVWATRYFNDGTYDLASDISGPLGITTATRYTVTVARAGHGFDIAGNVEGSALSPAASFAVVAGTTYTASVYVYNTAVVNVALRVRAADSSGNWVAAYVLGTTVSTVASGWVRVSVTYTVPAGASYLAYTLSTVGGSVEPVGSVWMATGLLLEYVGAVLDFFTGSKTPDGDLTPSWVGTENNSQSILSGVAPFTTWNAGSSPRVVVKSLNARSARIIPLGTTTDTALALNGDTGALRLGIVPGRTYTLLATCIVDTVQTGAIHTHARRMVPFYRSNGVYTSIPSAAAPNAVGETQLRHTFTIPSDADEAFIRLYAGGTTGNEIRWKDAMLVEGVYKGAYMDGDMSNSLWKGLSNGSVSVGYPSLV